MKIKKNFFILKKNFKQFLHESKVFRLVSTNLCRASSLFSSNPKILLQKKTSKNFLNTKKNPQNLFISIFFCSFRSQRNKKKREWTLIRLITMLFCFFESRRIRLKINKSLIPFNYDAFLLLQKSNEQKKRERTLIRLITMLFCSFRSQRNVSQIAENIIKMSSFFCIFFQIRKTIRNNDLK